MRRGFLAAVTVALVAGGGWVVWRAQGSLSRPNVVLIIGCTLRRDQLGAYGGPPDASPYLTARAGEGAVFEHGVTAAPWTKAGSAALVSGTHPATIGMVEPGEKPSRRKLPDAVHTLAEHFQGHGYQTFGATANPNLNEVFGFGQGFDAYVEGTRLWRLGGKAKVHGNHLVEEAGKVLGQVRDPERPLFAQILFTDAHAPATVKPFEKRRLQDPTVPDRVVTYRAMLARFDASVRLWVAELRRQGVKRRDTVFAVVNDHGEGLRWPEHHGMGHGNFTWPSTTRMPWIVWGAGVKQGRIGGMASQVDVFPTLAGLAGLPSPGVDGQDWSRQVREGGDTTRTVAFVDTWFQRARRSGAFSVDRHCHADWNVSAVPVCFDDEAAENVVPDGPSAELVDFHQRMERAFADYPHTQDAEPPASLTEQLEALGYVEGGDGAPTE